MMTELHRIHHMGISLDYLEAVLRERGNPNIFLWHGNPVSVPDALAAIAEKRQNGYALWPTCDHVDERGHCLGHDEEAS